jgi:integrase/recombinase XerD
MATRRGNKPVAAGNPNDPDSLAAWMKKYLQWMQTRNYSEYSVRNAQGHLSLFFQWCESRSIARPVEVNRPILESYQRHLFYLRGNHGKTLSFSTQYGRLTAVKSFFRWLTKQNAIMYNPAGELDMPRLEKPLPKHVLTAAEVDTVINQAEVRDLLGLRDRAIMETLYSTGIRRMELINLLVYDLDRERGTLVIRRGKGKKDRVVPIGERAVAWIDKYLEQSRPKIVMEPDDGVLFLTNLGERFTPNRLTQMVRVYVKAADLGKTGSCHLFRHSMATLMLENGADIRFIQHILGHERLNTTEVYTHVSIRELKRVHSETHPGAGLRPRK